MRFPLAAMDGLVLSLTALLFALAALFVFLGGWMTATGLCMLALYAVVWLLCRPTGFEVTPDELILVFPLYRRAIPRSRIVEAELFEGTRFSRERSWKVRVGAGGLFGAFGLLVCADNTYEMYVSRRSDLVVVWFDRRRPLLVSPADPVGFVGAL